MEEQNPVYSQIGAGGSGEGVTDTGAIRVFSTGATRDTAQDKLDFEGFLSPLCIERYAEYMHKHRLQSDGALRDSDNWQKGMGLVVYIKSMWRHFFAVWRKHRCGGDPTEDLCALLFNVFGYLHELLQERRENKKVAAAFVIPAGEVA